MRNSEVVVLVETVNTVMDSRTIGDDQLEAVAKWAQMGTDEFGTSPYKVISILAAELKTARESSNLPSTTDDPAPPSALDTPLPGAPTADQTGEASLGGAITDETHEPEEAGELSGSVAVEPAYGSPPTSGPGCSAWCVRGLLYD
jgi:hypothetical protein